MTWYEVEEDLVAATSGDGQLEQPLKQRRDVPPITSGSTWTAAA